jgi:hypothetical protein
VKTRRERIIVTAAVLAFGAVFAVLSLEHSWSARRFPLAAGLLTVVMASLQLIADIRRPASDDRSHAAVATPSEVTAIAWTAALVAGVYLAGLSIALPLFTGLYWRVRDKASWPVALAAALSVLAFVQGILVWLLGIDLYDGLLLQWLRR